MPKLKTKSGATGVLFKTDGDKIKKYYLAGG